MTVVEHLQQVAAVHVVEDSESPVVDHDHINPCQLLEQLAIAAVGAPDAQLIEQAGQAHVVGAIALPASLVRQGAGQPGLADAGLPGEQHILLLA